MICDDAVKKLHDFFSGSTPSSIKYVRVGDISIESLGVKDRAFRTRGGTWKGKYHHFMIDGCSFFNAIIHHGDSDVPYLIAGFKERSGATIQINLNKFLRDIGNECELFHDGRMTVYQGSVKRHEVIQRVRKYCPFLVDDRDKVIIGTIPLDNTLSLTNMRELLKNLFDYCVIRDEIKEEKRRERKEQKPVS